MVSREDVEKILDLAVQAPSGDNAQPWRFEVNNSRINMVLIFQEKIIHPIIFGNAGHSSLMER